MVTQIGKIKADTYFAGTRTGWFITRGYMVVVTSYPVTEAQYVRVTDLGRVRGQEQAEDKVKAIVDRERGLEATLNDMYKSYLKLGNEHLDDVRQRAEEIDNHFGSADQ